MICSTFPISNKTRSFLFIILTFSLIFVSKQSIGNINAALIDSSIKIESDADFLSLGFPGNGSESNPFLIQNLVLRAMLSYGIYIKDTSAYFIIRNCTISRYFRGIFIENVASWTFIIENNTCFDNSEAISIEHSNAGIIRFNNCSFNKYSAIRFETCQYIDVYENTMIGNYDNQFFGGMDIFYSFHLQIRDNYFANNSVAIYANEADMSNITNNEIYNSSDKAIILIESEYMRIENNSIAGSDFKFYACENSAFVNNSLVNSKFLYEYQELENISSYLFANNTVNSKPFELYVNLDSPVFTEEYGQLMLFNSQNVYFTDNIDYILFMNEVDNIIIENCNISAEIIFNKCESINIFRCNFTSISLGLRILYSSFIKVEQCNFDQSISGIICQYVNNASITSNYLSNLTSSEAYYGEIPSTAIFIYRVEDTIVEDNICTNSTAGIYVYNNRDNVTVQNNTCNFNTYGIYLSYNTGGCRIINNTCSYNVEMGIRADGHSNYYLNNLLYRNLKYGMYLNAFRGDVLYNQFIENYDYGLYVKSSAANVYYNNFTNNNMHVGSQVYFPYYSSYTTWYNSTSKMGNYWSDYDGYSFYQIDPVNGDERVFDRYPMVIDPWTDHDNDGLADMWEDLIGLDTSTDDSNRDFDKDKLSNLEEYEYRTHPFMEDTDSDLLLDGHEVKDHNSDPLLVDTDYDLYSDKEEVEANTDPSDPLSNPFIQFPVPAKSLPIYPFIIGGVILLIATTLIILWRKGKLKFRRSSS